MLLLLFFTAVVLVQIYFYYFLFGRFSRFRQLTNTVPKTNEPVSVVICAHNEAKNLAENIPFIAGQDYPEFEIVLVNDGSDDQTLSVMQELRERLQNDSKKCRIRIVDLPGKDRTEGKKKALHRGIEASAYQKLLLTDADCRPVSKNWIRLMTSGLTGNKKIVLGYGAYEDQNNSFLNKLIRFETVLTALQYFSYALAGKPYMGVGRNLAYTRDLFDESQHFDKHNDLLSGDDDLFVQEVAEADNTTVCLNKEAFTVSGPEQTFAAWFDQKRRHVSTSTRYRPGHQFLLGLFYVSQLLFWILGIFLLFKGAFIQAVLLLVGIRFLVWFARMHAAFAKLKEPGLLFAAPVLEFSLILSQLFIFIVNLISPPKKW